MLRTVRSENAAIVPRLTWIRLILSFALLLGTLASANAQSVTFTTNTAIPAGNTTYEGYDVTVQNCTVTIDGSHHFNSLTIVAGGVVTCTAGPNSAVNLTIAHDLIVGNGSIDVSARGYASSQGPGAGQSDAAAGNGGGAGYGGAGSGEYYTVLGMAGYDVGGGVYGSIQSPKDAGSGGGSGDRGHFPGGAGGGVICLAVGGTLQVNGSLLANGGAGQSGYDSTAITQNTGGGGGSGGSINATAATITGGGSIQANGGQGGYYAGGGAGGRIALVGTTNNFSGSTTAYGSYMNYANVYAACGTIYRRFGSQTKGDLLIDAGNHYPVANTILTQPQTFDNISIVNQAIVSPMPLQTLDLTALNNFTIAGTITADGLGFPAAQGPGAGASRPAADGHGAGGAGYGGEGVVGDNSGSSAGLTYGSVTNPVDMGLGEEFGSGGGNYGNYAGGAGGGAIRLTAGGALTIGGTVTAVSGPISNNNAGGGSGGSIVIAANTLAGGGTLSVYGGTCASPGGGGRVAIRYTDKTNWTGRITTRGGEYTATGRTGLFFAGCGTLFEKGPNQANGELIIDTNGFGTNYAQISDRYQIRPGAVLNGPAVFDRVSVINGGCLVPPIGQKLDLTVLGDMLVGSGSYVSADSRGYDSGQGPGAAPTDITNNLAGGGGYGGVGGSYSAYYYGFNPGGGVYGSMKNPTDFGSGGGAGYFGALPGAAGGGAIRLRVNGTLSNLGTIGANGDSNTVSNYYSVAGGSGGSVYINAVNFTGGGGITANGGGVYAPGGGGRIALYYIASSFNGAMTSAAGYYGSYGAQNGTVYTQQVAANISFTLGVSPSVVGGGQSAVGTVTLSQPAPEGGVSINLVSSDPSVTVLSSVQVPEGATAAAFGIATADVTSAKTVTITGTAFGLLSQAQITVKPILSSLRLSQGSANGGTTLTGTLTLSVPAPTGGLTVNLASSDGSVTVPSSVTFASGVSTRTFSVAVSAVTTARLVNITATYGSEAVAAQLGVNPAGVQVASIYTSPASVLAGNSASGVVTLTGRAPAGGLLVALSSGTPSAATVPNFVTVPAGASSASFSIATYPIAATTSVLISASLGVTKTGTLTVRMPGVASLQLIPATISGGDTSVGVITLDAVPTSSVVVTIISSNPAAIPDRTLLFAPGQNNATFNIATSAVSALTRATITAQANGTQKSQILTINP